MINIYKLTLIISFFATVVGAMFKIMHWPGASLLLNIGVVLSLVYILIALTNIYKSDKSIIEKILWLIGFISLSWITGLVFYFKEMRKK